jgi:hypothetical protein
VFNPAYCSQFKHVSLNDACLVIADDRRIAHVPIGHIKRVAKIRSTNPPGVMLVLRTPSKFGRRIMFIPRAGGRLIVSRLRRLCDEHPDTVCPTRLDRSA